MPEPRNTTFLEVERIFTNDELLEMAREIAKLDAQQDALKLEKKLAASEWGAAIDDNEKKRKMISSQIRDGKEWTQVECRFERSMAKGTIRYFDLQTGELVNERDMIAEERQMTLEDLEKDLDECDE